MGHEACRPAQSHQSVAGQCGRAGQPLIRMYTPTPLGSRTRRERGGEGGESAQTASTGAASGGEETPHRPSHSHAMP